jgi:hypothetical protein
MSKTVNTRLKSRGRESTEKIVGNSILAVRNKVKRRPEPVSLLQILETIDA